MSWPGMDTGHPLSEASAEIDGRRERVRAPRPTRLLDASRSVTIMANCVPCLFRKTGPGTGSGWVPASGEIGSAWCRCRSGLW